MGNVTQNNGMIGNGSDLFIGYPMEMFFMGIRQMVCFLRTQK